MTVDGAPTPDRILLEDALEPVLETLDEGATVVVVNEGVGRLSSEEEADASTVTSELPEDAARKPYPPIRLYESIINIR